jgi:NAD(P)H-quinone oxidoreductase subunit 6
MDSWWIEALLISMTESLERKKPVLLDVIITTYRKIEDSIKKYKKKFEQLCTMNLSESIHQGILTLIELGILLGSLGVVLLANVIHSAFLLGLVFTCVSLSYLVLNADSVAAAQLLIYVGAINVLIVSAVMVTDEPAAAGSRTSTSLNIGYSIASVVCIGLSSLLIVMIHGTKWSNVQSIDRLNFSVSVEDTSNNNVQEAGYQLLTTFIVPFESLSVLLLIALVGAITMARNDGLTTKNKKKFPQPSREKSSF